MSELVVIGDTLLDRDVEGTADRVCPEAPALVLQEQHTVDRPGGAGLAALLAAAAGHRVTLVTALAEDPGGQRLSQLLTEAGIELLPLPLPGSTPEKVRLRADGQVLLRWDRGGERAAAGLPAPTGPALAEALAAADAVLVSDYGRGVSRLPEVRSALAGISAPVVWDPHPRGAPATTGARLVTPNEPELAALVGIAPAVGNRRLAGLAHGAGQLRERWRVGAVAVTLGGDGALLCHAGPTPLVVPVPTRVVGDTCGAGDRFAVSAAVALGAGALVSEAVEAAVAEAAGYVAAGAARAVCPSRTAVAPAPGGGGEVDPQELVTAVHARGGTVVATGGCFDLLHAGHIATLEAARSLGDCLVVCVNSDRSVAGLKGPGRPLVPEPDRVRLLSALSCVDAVVTFDEPTPEAVLSWLRPDIWVKGGDYAGGTPDTPDLPEAKVVGRWGGQTVIVPYLAGRSSTSLITAARRNGRRED